MPSFSGLPGPRAGDRVWIFRGEDGGSKSGTCVTRANAMGRLVVRFEDDGRCELVHSRCTTPLRAADADRRVAAFEPGAPCLLARADGSTTDAVVLSRPDRRTGRCVVRGTKYGGNGHQAHLVHFSQVALRPAVTRDAGAAPPADAGDAPDEPPPTADALDEPKTTDDQTYEPTTTAEPLDEPPTPTGPLHEPTTTADPLDESTTTDDPTYKLTTTDVPLDEPTTPADTLDEPTTPTDVLYEPTTPAGPLYEPTTTDDPLDEPTTPTDSLDEPTTPADSLDEPTTPTDGHYELPQYPLSSPIEPRGATAAQPAATPQPADAPEKITTPIWASLLDDVPEESRVESPRAPCSYDDVACPYDATTVVAPPVDNGGSRLAAATCVLATPPRRPFLDLGLSNQANQAPWLDPSIFFGAKTMKPSAPRSLGAENDV